MSKYAVLVTWREITGTEPTMSLLHERLAPFRLTSVLLGLARLTAALKTWENQPQYALDQAFVTRFLPSYAATIMRLCQSGKRMTFSRLGILSVAKQACISCEVDGAEVRSSKDVEQILSCCLLANDLALEERPSSSDPTLDRASNLLPFASYMSHDTYSTEIARSLLLIEEIGPMLADRTDYLDVADLFRTATGVTSRQFCEMAFGASLKFITKVNEQMTDSTSALLLTPQYFKHTTLAPGEVGAFLDRFSAAPETLFENARNRLTRGLDFRLFQEHPLVRFATGTYLCIDPGFLLDKAGAGLYWTLHFGQPPASRGALLAYWPHVVERYVLWLVEQTYQGRGTCFPSPHFGNGDEACDLAILEGGRLLFTEVKASVLTVEAKYSFSGGILGDELNRKVIVGEGGKRKGVSQLSTNIRRFLGGDDIEGIDRSKVHTIFPALVLLDRSFAAPFLATLYNERFDGPELRKQYPRITLTPLFTLTVDDVENTLPHTNRHDLVDILESFWRVKRNTEGNLSYSRVPLIRGKKPGKDVVRERYKRFGEEMERLFPTPQDVQSARE